MYSSTNSDPDVRTALAIMVRCGRILQLQRVLALSTPVHVDISPGRPSHSWFRAVEVDLKPLNIGLVSAWKKTNGDS